MKLKDSQRYSKSQLEGFEKVCKTPLDLRDAAAIALLRIIGGMRRQELAHLTLADLRPT
ncbi:hypothetical protein [Gloeocapsa sp. PCC 7428]|uniref:hypothetical protein n=1 Tax=Gloeocapsa sp. PCC 7428 TaxID=1173026 RepID=UPI000305ACAA|nr:hypothetical protein [Gloeocapsa sp. PCC 7428]